MMDVAQRLAGARVVVTGGLGLIGSTVARAAAAAGATVVAIDALVPEHGGDRANLRDAPVLVVEHDLRNAEGLTELVAGADVIFNLAGQRSHTDSMRDPVHDLEHNCRAPLTLLESCRGLISPPLVVYASTRQVYGRPTSLPVDESHPALPIDINGIHKVAAESYHQLYHDVHGVPTVVLRLTNTYGPGMRTSDARQGFLGAWIDSVLSDRSFEVWDGTQRRDFTYVDDAARALILAATEPRARGGLFNIGGETATLGEVADLLVQVNGSGSYGTMPLPPEAAAIDIGDYAADDSAFRALTGWSPVVPLADGLRRTLEHHRARLAAPARVA